MFGCLLTTLFCESEVRDISSEQQKPGARRRVQAASRTSMRSAGRKRKM